MKWCLVVLILAGVTRADNSVERDYAILTCPDLNSQEEIDLNEIMGKWYVVEVLEHKVDPLKPAGISIIVDSCPIVNLRSVENSSKFFSSLRLLWTEHAGNLEYTFRIPDISRKPGFWISTSLQNGSRRDYRLTVSENGAERGLSSVTAQREVVGPSNYGIEEREAAAGTRGGIREKPYAGSETVQPVRRERARNEGRGLGHGADFLLPEPGQSAVLAAALARAHPAEKRQTRRSQSAGSPWPENRQHSGDLYEQRRLEKRIVRSGWLAGAGIATSLSAGTKKRINELANGHTLMNRPIPGRKWNDDISPKEIFSRERAWD
ncbi:hypothetical protein WN51_10380 [Melipona quadrifasciata]|uniref:Apolipoprotein D n=1 Tax=Melipona quadrifasciata TaxID=166423 RepID=A0A0M9A5P3_9HYME|nr:hypothetical protein WN51_10380 [Melipona quadrifasciata]